MASRQLAQQAPLCCTCSAYAHLQPQHATAKRMSQHAKSVLQSHTKSVSQHALNCATAWRTCAFGCLRRAYQCCSLCCGCLRSSKSQTPTLLPMLQSRHASIQAHNSPPPHTPGSSIDEDGVICDIEQGLQPPQCSEQQQQHGNSRSSTKSSPAALSLGQRMTREAITQVRFRVWVLESSSGFTSRLRFRIRFSQLVSVGSGSRFRFRL